MLGILIYILVALFLLFEMALQVSPSVMTRYLMQDFQIGAAALGVMSSFYYYSYTAMQIPAGLLYDRFSAKVLIPGAVFICTLGAFFFGFTDQIVWAGCGRFFMGFGSAFAFIGVLVMAARWFPKRYFALLVGIAQMLAAIGALSGELPIATLLEKMSWRSVMLLFGGIGLCLTFLCLFVIRDSPSGKRPRLERHDLKKELKEIIRSRQTWWTGLYAFCSWGPIAVFAALWGVPYLEVRFDVSGAEAAFAMAILWMGIACTAPVIGWLSDKEGKRRPLLQLTALVGFLASLALFYFPGIPFSVAFLFLFGIGVAGAGQILSFAVVKDNNRPTIVGTAIGLNNMAVVAGGALLQPLFGWLLHFFWKGGRDALGVPIYSVSNYDVGLLMVPICFLISLLVSTFCIQETYCRSKHAL